MRLPALIAFVVGVCVLQWQSELPSATMIALIAGVALLLLLPLIQSSRLPATKPAAVAAIALLGFAYAAGLAALRMSDELAFDDEGRDIAVIGVIANLPAKLERGVRFEFDVEHSTTPNAHAPSRVLLGWYNGNVAVQPGERWSFTVRLKRPHGTMNPGGFDFEAWMLERNLRASGYVRAGRNDAPRVRVDAMVWRPSYAIERARSWLRDRLQPLLVDKRYGGVLAALVLGDQRAISDADWTLFNRTGIGHLVSISGLHITMIASLVGFAVGALWRRSPSLLARAAAQTAAVSAGLLAAVSYALLAGWGVPAQRTVVMLATVGVAWILNARIGAATSLALAAALVCLLDPWAVLAPGFWLSFCAVAAIVWVMQGRPRAVWRWKSVLRAAARVQLAVTLALIPATVVLFHQLSLVSPLANAVAIPIVSWAVTPLALIGAVFTALSAEWIAAPVFSVANKIFGALAAVLQWSSTYSWATLPVATPPFVLVALASIGVIWLLAPPGWPLRAIGALAILPMFVWPALRAEANEIWVTALDIGQGSALLIETVDQFWLYDAGPRYSIDSDAGERIIVPYLRHRGIGRLDGMIVSHLDSDHSGGAASVLRAIDVKRVISSIGAGHPVLDARNDVERCESGRRWNAGGLQFAVLHPSAGDYAATRTTNAMSCVVLISAGATRLLLTGDVPADDERTMNRREPGLSASWLSVPHHGSRSSSSDALLDSLGATSAAVQAGYRNRFRHPDREVVNRYQGRNIRLHRTDHSGALQWRFREDGKYELSASRRTHLRYWHNRPGPLPVLTPDGDAGDASPGPPDPLVRG